MNIEKIQSLLVDFKILYETSVFSRLPLNKHTLAEFTKIHRQLEQENKKSSINFNIFKYFHPTEPIHSKLIAMLLDPNGEHGQGTLFLHSFLDMIGIQFDKSKDNWTVTAEKDRIDILIKSTAGHVIIIENKSNWAVDQDSQLYRYWYLVMFFPNRLKYKDPVYTLNDKGKFRIIYLVPNEQKNPSEVSLRKSETIDPNNIYGLPNEIKMEQIDQLTFNKHITGWLEKLLVNFDSNHRLREYLKQYIELWRIN
jgi:hypothetical protein